MDLQLYLDILKRRALVIAVVAAVVVSAVTAGGLLISPVYTASATVRVMLDVGVTDLMLWEDYSRRLLNTYTHILGSTPILEEALDRLSPRTSSLTVNELRENIEVAVVPGTELISVSVGSGDPGLSRDLTNTLTTLLIEYGRDLYVGSGKSTLQIVEEQLTSLEADLASDRQELEDMLAEGRVGVEIESLESQIQFKEDSYDRLLDRYELARLNESLRSNSITVVESASLPQEPSNGLGLKYIGLSVVVGLFGGVGLALVLESLDTRIHSSQQLERLTNLPVLGTAPRGLLALDTVESGNGVGKNSSLAEAYRLLGINLQSLRHDNALRTILITSATSGEGKSTTTASLAQALAERGQTVFLVESDLRHPSIAKMMDIDDGHTGLSTLLSERPAFTKEFLSQIVYPAKQPSLFVISAGAKVANPTAQLDSPSVEALLDYLGAQGQTTLLDAPPVLGVADVSVLAPKADGVILVVGQARSTREQVLAALKQLQASRARVLGFVFLQKSDKEWGYD